MPHYEFHLFVKTFDMRGCGVPVSSIVLIGVSRDVAWGRTALAADEADSYLLAIDKSHPVAYQRQTTGPIKYQVDIDRVEQAKSTLLDGWGIHLSLRRGWTWNLWGFDCVDVWFTKAAKTKKVRIGTDDPEGLTAFLRQAGKQLHQ